MDPEKDQTAKLLKVWRRNLEVLQRSQPSMSEELRRKVEILALAHQLETPPMAETVVSNDAPGSSEDPIETEIVIHKQLAAILDDVLQPLDDLIQSKSDALRNKHKGFSDPADRIVMLKERTRTLTMYLKTVITEYLLVYQFPQLAASKDTILKLIEVLLNNSVSSSITGEPVWLLLREREDPLIRFLILHQLVVVDPSNKNRVRLNHSYTAGGVFPV